MKEYGVDLSKLKDGHLWSFEKVKAKSKGKARAMLLKEYGTGRLKNGDHITFINLPVICIK